MISESYRKMNQEMHRKIRTYGNNSAKWAKHIEVLRDRTILDYGCGKGKLAKSVDFPISEYDPCVPGKDAEPVPHECVVCTDVLEHIEPEHLDSVLAHIQSLMLDAGFFVISTKAAKKQLPDGRNAHLIIKPTSWWHDKLSEYFKIAGVRNDVTQECEAIFYVERKHD